MNMAINNEQLAQEAIDAIRERINNLTTLNIIVAGKTGVGKSTLINSVFREKLADTGMGKPVTPHMRKISKKGMPLNIYDTRGFELNEQVQADVNREIMETINQGLAKQDINAAIHCIWYCINTAANRVDPAEIEWIRSLTEDNKTTQVPIIIVLTQSFSKKNAQLMRRSLLEENLDVIQIVPVLAEDYDIDDEYVARSFGLDALIQVMGEALPEELVNTLQNVQIACLGEKKRHSQKVVAATVTAAATLAAVPIPLADCAMLIPTQLGMIASITVIFGFDISKSVLAGFLSATLGSGGATLLGKTIVTNLLKLIPGAGSVTGAVISSGTAGVLTAALGEAYIGILELVFKGEMSIDDLATKKGKEMMTEMFKAELKKKRD